MATIAELLATIAEINSRTGKYSIGKNDVFNLFRDIVNRVQSAEFNMSNLSIRKIYGSVDEMNADVVAPIGDDGITILKGQLVAISNESDTTESGEVYRYSGNSWEYLATIGFWEGNIKDLSIAFNKLTQAAQDMIRSGGNVVNNPDDEDLYTAPGSVLKLADRVNYKFIRAGFDWTADLTAFSNKVLEIRTEHDLDGENVMLPPGATLFFNGGRFKNGGISFNETTIQTNIDHIFENCTLEGSIVNDKINIRWFGANGNGITDNTAYIQQALDCAASINGANLLFPKGVYLCSGQLELNTPICVNIIGEGTDNTLSGGSILIYTGTGTHFLKYAGVDSRHYAIDNISIVSNNAAFTGILLDCGGFGVRMSKVTLSALPDAECLLNLKNNLSVDVYLEQVRFNGAKYAVKGEDSNAVVFMQCAFDNQELASILNTGQGWSFIGCSFEPLSSKDGGTTRIAGAIKSTNVNAQSLTINGCWFGDLVDAELSPDSYWIEWAGNGLNICGNQIRGGGWNSSTAIRINGLANGITITGNYFSNFKNCVDLQTNLASDVQILANRIRNSGNVLAGNILHGTLISQQWDSEQPDQHGRKIKMDCSISTTGSIETMTDDIALNAKGNTKSIVRGEFEDVAPNTIMGTAIGVQSKVASSYKSGIYILRGDYPDLLSWAFSCQAGAGQEKNILEIHGYESSVNPSADNSVTCGIAAKRWSEIFAANGVINTSDEREKTELVTIEDKEKACARELKDNIKKFKFLESVSKKGSSARIHFGVGAQTVRAIFEKHGLDAESYSLFCFDSWDEKPAITEKIKDDSGELKTNVIQEKQDKGDRFGIRYNELFAFILSSL